jgi:hypothetical protein
MLPVTKSCGNEKRGIGLVCFRGCKSLGRDGRIM